MSTKRRQSTESIGDRLFQSSSTQKDKHIRQISGKSKYYDTSTNTSLFNTASMAGKFNSYTYANESTDKMPMADILINRNMEFVIGTGQATQRPNGLLKSGRALSVRPKCVILLKDISEGIERCTDLSMLRVGNGVFTTSRKSINIKSSGKRAGFSKPQKSIKSARVIVQSPLMPKMTKEDDAKHILTEKNELAINGEAFLKRKSRQPFLQVPCQSTKVSDIPIAKRYLFQKIHEEKEKLGHIKIPASFEKEDIVCFKSNQTIDSIMSKNPLWTFKKDYLLKILTQNLKQSAHQKTNSKMALRSKSGLPFKILVFGKKKEDTSSIRTENSINKQNDIKVAEQSISHFSIFRRTTR